MKLPWLSGLRSALRLGVVAAVTALLTGVVLYESCLPSVLRVVVSMAVVLGVFLTADFVGWM